jgi:2-aminobenzoate-CoA ligase
MSRDDVMECAVVAAPDEARGHVVKAFVVPAGGLDALPDEDTRAVRAKELQDHVKSVIAPYKYPRVIEFVDALPRTSSGKLQRFKLRQLERQKAGEPAL